MGKINQIKHKRGVIPKTPSGISGLDEITDGGLPAGRPTLICGSPGCGKTIMALQFLVKGATDYHENGIFMSFEEPVEDLILNSRSMGMDLETLMKQKKIRIDRVKIDRSEIEETGEYDLEGIFVRLNHAIDTIGAKRVVLDTLESLFGGLSNEMILRSEIRRLFHWLKEKGVTAVITAEGGTKTLTRQGLEEYVSDCVILLDFRVIDQIATRRLRIIKYRGSVHGTNEYPFLIDDAGVSVMPITSLKLDHRSSTEIISSGIPALDELFSLKGIFRGSSILISGSAGTAKTILASYLAEGSCKRNESVLFLSFEESPDQLLRNMKSIGIRLQKYIKAKLLHIHSDRPTRQGLEMHLLRMHKLIEDHRPKMVIVDPISSLITIGTNSEVKAMLVRMIDMLKSEGITAVFTSLSHEKYKQVDTAEDAISSLADIWIKLINTADENTLHRQLHIIKARGMGHQNKKVQFHITNKGLRLLLGKDNPSS